MAGALAALGRPDEAITQYDEVIRRAGSGQIYGRMARLGKADTQAHAGQVDAAIATWKEMAASTTGEFPVDAILMEQQGIPAVAIVTTPFRNTGEAMAASWGKPGYPFVDTPHPIANLTERELDERADALVEAVERCLQMR